MNVMDIIAVSLFILLFVTSVSLLYVAYQLSVARKHLQDAIKICEDAVNSLRSGGP